MWNAVLDDDVSPDDLRSAFVEGTDCDVEELRTRVIRRDGGDIPSDVAPLQVLLWDVEVVLASTVMPADAPLISTDS